MSIRVEIRSRCAEPQTGLRTGWRFEIGKEVRGGKLEAPPSLGIRIQVLSEADVVIFSSSAVSTRDRLALVARQRCRSEGELPRMMRTGPSGDRGALRGRAHFLSFLSDEERCCLFTSAVTSPCRSEAFSPLLPFCFFPCVADALLMSLFRGGASAGRKDCCWLTGWAQGTGA